MTESPERQIIRLPDNLLGPVVRSALHQCTGDWLTIMITACEEAIREAGIDNLPPHLVRIAYGIASLGNHGGLVDVRVIQRVTEILLNDRRWMEYLTQDQVRAQLDTPRGMAEFLAYLAAGKEPVRSVE